MLKVNKKILIFFCILGIITSYFIINLYLNKKNKLILENKDSKLISIKLQDKNGDYIDSEIDAWPKEGYIFNKELSTCENGGEVNFENGQIVLNTNGSEKCTIYFDNKKTYTLLTSENIKIENQDTILTNMIKNGSYEEGTNKWNNVNCEVTSEKSSHGNKSLKFNVVGYSMSDQTLDATAPTYNHSYYGRIMFLSSDTFIVGDSRYEWFAGDFYGINDLLFTYKNIQTTEWTLLSYIVKLNSNDYTSEQWIIRNFLIDANDITYTDELMMIDLTESYPNELPTTEWLDKNLVYFDGTVNIKTIDAGNKAEFKIENGTGTITCNNGGTGSISSDGIVTITGNNINTTCIIK